MNNNVMTANHRIAIYVIESGEIKNMKKNVKYKEKKKIGIVWTLLTLVALCVFCYAGSQLLFIYLEYKKGADEYIALEKHVDPGVEAHEAKEEMNEDSDDQMETIKNPIDFTSLTEINHEVIAWLRVKAIDVNYPVAQGADNDYYLHRTFEKKPVFSGCIFMDYRNSKDFSDRNTIIYGHNMKDGSMFGKLKRFHDPEVYHAYPYFWLYTPDRAYKFKIFSCQEVGSRSESYQIEFKDDKEFEEYLAQSKKNSVVPNDVSVDGKDTIVTLSTCTGDASNRLVVQGKLMKTYLAE